MDIAGAVALVTGGASGLGAVTVKALFAAGASVVLVDLPGSAGAEMATSLMEGRAQSGAEGSGGPQVVFVPADVTSEDDVRAAVEAATAAGPLRIVVNCAGVATPGRVLGRDGVLPLEAFDHVIRINLVGTFNVIRLAAEAMAGTEPVVSYPDSVAGNEAGRGDFERGVIINTASVAAFDGQIGQAAYSASKGAVAAMTLPLARELARSQIRVVTIAPGLFQTPMMAKLPPEAQESLGGQVPHPARMGLPFEYAKLVAHIVDNAMLNGETIRLDGAIRMAPK